MSITHREDLTTLLHVAGRPIRVEEAAAAMGLRPEEVLALIEELVGEGLVRDTEAGVSLVHEDFEPSSASRTAFLAGKWADALRSLEAAPGEIGLALLTAGRHEQAAEYLAPAALYDDTLDLIEAAIASGEAGARLSPDDEGRLRLARARHYRARGDSLGAASDLEIAVRRLDGAELVDALGFAAAVADDLQHPQQSETLAALAAGLAADIDEPAKQGSLLTLQGRELSRIGLAEEADRSIAMGRQLIEDHGDETQRDYAHWNQAWVMLDRGEVRKAEAEFGILVDHARDQDPVTLAEREAYWARSLFAMGNVSEALKAASRAETLATGEDADAPRFIASLGRTEGTWFLGRYEDSLEHAEKAHDIARRTLPAHENVSLVGQAKALAGLGRREEAGEKLEAALEATPEGIDGWRWRIRAEAVELTLTAEEEKWPKRRAEDLTDALLQARWHDAAVALMAERARRESDRELALQAAALAMQLGNPMLAAVAVEAAGAWGDAMVSKVARAVAQMESHIPAEWRDEWMTFPPVASAHGVDLEDHAEEEPALEQHIDDALRAAGLAGTEMILSPAQRQARGLVRRRPSRTRRIMRAVAVAAGVVVLSAGTALAVGIFTGGEEPATTLAAPTAPTAPQTTIPRMEDTIIPRPSDTGVFGVAAYRGGNARTGVTDGGFRTAVGKYWDLQPAGSIETDPVAFGHILYLGTANPDRLLYIGLDNGLVLQASVETGDRVRSSPAFDPAGGTSYLVFGTGDGRLYATDTGRDQSYWNPPESVDDVVSATPLLFGNVAVVVTEAGAVLALSIEDIGTGMGVGDEPDAGDGTSWTYTGTEAVPLGAVNTSPASDGTDIYVVDEEGWLHVIELATGAPSCEPIRANGRLARNSNPIVSGGIVYLPTTEGNLDRLEIGSCVLQPPLIVGPNIFDLAPAIHDNVVYTVEGPWLQAFDVPPEALNAAELWTFTSEGQDPITTAPVLAEGVLYVGTQGGMVYAVDAGDGSELWRWDARATIVGTPAVLGNAVVVVTEDTVIAIAGE